MWLITVEFTETRINARRTLVWKQTLLTRKEPDGYVAERHDRRYFVGREDESRVEMILLCAVLVEDTPERGEMLGADGEAVIGSMCRTEVWSA